MGSVTNVSGLNVNLVVSASSSVASDGSTTLNVLSTAFVTPRVSSDLFTGFNLTIISEGVDSIGVTSILSGFTGLDEWISDKPT